MYNYNEKKAYEQHRHSKQSSYSSFSSINTTSSQSDPRPCHCSPLSRNPPAYASLFFNTMSDKPLPPLPQCENKRQVQFMLQKPLPPLPNTEKEDRKAEGDYAWWNKVAEMSDAEYARYRREKEEASSY